MGKITFKFGSTLQKGNSCRKLIVYLHGQTKCETVYSFDGRLHRQSKENRLTDDEKYFCEENAEIYLKNRFDDPKTGFSHLNVKAAYIADSFYDGTLGQIYTVWSDGHWTTQEVANRRLHEKHIAVRAASLPQYYTFRLAMPTCKDITGKVKWRNFYTQEIWEGKAMVDLIAQFRKYRDASPKIIFQEIGQLYGKEFGKFPMSDFLNAPRFGYLETKTCTPRYHRTATHQAQSVIKGYAEIQENAKDISEMVSNYLA
jgi:hypothetical protein